MSVPFRFAKSRPSSDWERERSEDWEGDPDNLLDRCLPLPLTLCLLLLLLLFLSSLRLSSSDDSDELELVPLESDGSIPLDDFRKRLDLPELLLRSSSLSESSSSLEDL